MALDRITVSVIQHRLESIVQEMGEAMLRTAYSQILNSSRDFSTAVFDGEGRLAAQAEHVPIHVGALPWAVKAVAEYFKGRIRSGDMYLLNDPYHGGNHLPDLTVLLPVFVGERLAFWSINRAHQSDIGGATHGALIGGVPRALLAWRRGEPTTARLWAARSGIYVLVAVLVLVLGANFANAQLARRRADTLIAACRQYEARQGRLPDRLDELVPDFIPSVPLAKYTLGLNTFMYIAGPGHHSLMWVALPPFGRPYYVFEENRWGYLD